MYLNQNYYELKKTCLNGKNLFCDDKFQANAQSLARVGHINLSKSKISWKRPHEIVKNPKFLIDSLKDPTHINQGVLGDCWLISSIVAVSKFTDYINLVLPKDEQSFEEDKYAGIFHFRLWRFGEWLDVVVDDLLPVNEFGELIYCRNSLHENEMFGPLLEKAYAKLNTCYEFLIAGEASDAMVDLTSGVCERFYLSEIRQTVSAPLSQTKLSDKMCLWNLMFTAYFMKSLMATCVKTKEKPVIELVEKMGLVIGHAYCILEVVEIYLNEQTNLFDKLRTHSDESSRENSVKLLR